MFYSLVIPTFERAPVVKDCVFPSIEKMGFPRKNVELIWIDDGSKNRDVHDLMWSLHPDKVLIKRHNEGTVKTKNQGFDLAGGDYIIVMDSDFLMNDNWLGLLDYSINQSPQLEVIALSNLNRGKWQGDSKEINSIKVKPMKVNLVTGVFAISRNVLNRVGYLDEDFGFYGLNDADWTYRIRRAGFDIHYIDSIGGDHKGRLGENGDNREKKQNSMNKNMSLLNWKIKQTHIYYNPRIDKHFHKFVDNEFNNGFKIEEAE